MVVPPAWRVVCCRAAGGCDDPDLYFPRYSQRENFETNNTLLLLRQLYNFNRFRFQKFLSKLLPQAITEPGSAFELGLQIKQQVGTGASIVDGYLYQESLRIAIETKRSSQNFAAEQLSGHLESFAQSKGGFLILLSPERVEDSQLESVDWKSLVADASAKNVILVPVSFENLIAAARECLNDYDEEMHALVTDYEEFCSQEDLLPVDKWTMFVPPSGKSREINAAQRLYFCPASWSRRKARYLGLYYDKAVRHIGTIGKVVECEIKGGQVVSERQLTKQEQERIAAASVAAMDQQGWDITTGYQFFLCDDMCPTEFAKSSPGGIMGHRYFDLRKFFPGKIPTQLPEIAARLRNVPWESREQP
jgi:hypothetical protein